MASTANTTLGASVIKKLFTLSVATLVIVLIFGARPVQTKLGTPEFDVPPGIIGWMFVACVALLALSWLGQPGKGKGK